MTRFRRCCGLALVVLLVVVTVCLGHPEPVAAQGEVPISLRLTGWGWCVAYKEIGSVVADLTGSKISRDNATAVQDIYLTGTVSFNLSDKTDSFEVELRGTKVRSLFFLRQVSGGDTPLVAEFEGTWLGETDYVACEGVIAVPAPNHIAKPYIVLLRTEDTDVPERSGGGWVGNLDFAVQRITSAFDAAADRISYGGSVLKESLGELLASAAVIVRELRRLGVPYVT